VIDFDLTVKRMADSLKEEARRQGVSLKGLMYDNFNNFLDEAFGDGGEVRCEKFCDLAWPYAAKNTIFGSHQFDVRQHKCIKAAILEIAEGDREVPNL
jgi:hypothetical protein